MNRRFLLTLAVPLALAPVGCDEPVNEPEPVQAAAITTASRDDLDARLLPSLASRKSYSPRQVKIDLSKPALRVELSSPSGRRSVIDAWPGEACDLNVPMVRVDFSDQLQAITPAEWTALQRRAGR